MSRDVTQCISFKARQIAKHLSVSLNIEKNGMFSFDFVRGYCMAHEDAEGVHKGTYYDEVKPLLTELCDAIKRNDENHVNLLKGFFDFVSPSQHIVNWGDGTFEDLFSK